MELIPFLIFAFIAFKVFTSFTKVASKNGTSAKEMMQRLNEQIQDANKTQGRTPNMSRYEDKTPTQRGRERMAQKNQSSPWNHEHDVGGDSRPLSPGAKVAANYLKKTKTARIASHKNEEQHGRRGINMDQNRHRTDEWGQRGESGFLDGNTILILLVVGAIVLFALSKMPAI